MNKNSFLIALYNLHLPNEIPPSDEVKQRLTKTVWKHYRIIPPLVIGEQSVTPNYNNNQPIHIFPVDEGGNKIGRGITIAKNYLGDGLSDNEANKLLEVEDDLYESSDNKWWKNDYPAFLEEYAHLRNFIDDYLSGKFKIENYEWVNEVSKILEYQLTRASEIAEGVVIETPFMAKRHEKIDINRVNIRLLPSLTYTTANAAILKPAYHEIIDLIKEKSKIRRCKRNGCNNIFLKSGNQKYCDTCQTPAKREVDKQTKRKKAKLNHIRLSALIDQWLPEKGEISITASSLMWKLKKISVIGKSRFLQSPRSLGRYLNLKKVQDILKEKGIHIEVCKDRKGATYKFTRSQ